MAEPTEDRATLAQLDAGLMMLERAEVWLALAVRHCPTAETERVAREARIADEALRKKKERRMNQPNDHGVIGAIEASDQTDRTGLVARPVVGRPNGKRATRTERRL